MKKIVFLLLFVPMFSMAQRGKEKRGWYYFSEVLQLPSDTIHTAPDNSLAFKGGVVYKKVSGVWVVLVGGGFSNPMTTAGDLIIGGSSGTPTRLALGSALQQIRVNSGGTALEYFTSTAITGSGTNLQIPYMNGTNTLTSNSNYITDGTSQYSAGGAMWNGMYSNPASGTWMGVGVTGGTAFVTSFNYGGSVATPFEFQVGTFNIKNNGTSYFSGTTAGVYSFVNGINTGVAGSTIGGITLAGNTSGTVSILPQAAAGTYNFNLPTSAGTSGFFFTSAGGGSSPNTWTDVSAWGHTAGSGLTNSSGTWTANLITGKLGGQTIIGGTAANDPLLIEANTASSGNTGTTDAIVWNVGNSASTRGGAITHNGLVSLRYLTGTTAIGTITASTGAGTSPTVAIHGTDLGGYISVTTGTGPSASGTVVTVAFGNTQPSAPRCIMLTPANANAAALTGTNQIFIDQSIINTGGFAITAGSAALTASTAYVWYYTIII